MPQQAYGLPFFFRSIAVPVILSPDLQDDDDDGGDDDGGDNDGDGDGDGDGDDGGDVDGNGDELRQAHVWGCPTYTLNYCLQNGQKRPKWELRAWRGVFLGISKKHSSNVLDITNVLLQ